jgi:hypothetical protein
VGSADEEVGNSNSPRGNGRSKMGACVAAVGERSQRAGCGRRRRTGPWAEGRSPLGNYHDNAATWEHQHEKQKRKLKNQVWHWKR